MAFDAGTIVARLDLDDDEFARKLAEDVRKVEAFEKAEHEIRLTPKVDEHASAAARQQFRRLDDQITREARSRGGVLGTLHRLFGGGGAAGGGAVGGGGGGGSFLGRLLGGIGPGMLGIGGRSALLAGAGGVGLAALPAALGVAGVAGVGGLGVGALALGAKELIGTKQAKGPLYAQGVQAGKDLKQGFDEAIKPMTGPLRQVLSQIPQLMRSITPALRQAFAGAATLISPLVHGLTDLARMILPVLGRAFRAIAPDLRPLIDGIGLLVRGLLTGLIPLLRAAHPAITAFARILGTLGRDLGSMFRALAPAVRASSVVLKALFDVLGAVFPIIVHIAAVMARTLSPVVLAFAGAIRSLVPVITIIGRILAQFVGAVLTVLVAALTALARLITDLAPSFRILASVLGQVFRTMENAGVFATLGAAVEQLVPMIARLVNVLVRQLAPFIPPIIRVIGILARSAIGVLMTAVRALLPVLITLIRTLLPPLLQIVRQLAPVIAVLARMFAAGLAAALVLVVKALAPLLIVLARVIALTLNWLSRTKLIFPVLIALLAILYPVPVAIAAIGIAIGLLVTHWHRAWTDIKNWAMDAWNFLTHGWGQVLIPELTAIRWVIEMVRDHWRQAWNDIRSIGLGAWHLLHDDVIAPLVNVFTQGIPNAFRSAVSAVGRVWSGIKAVVTAPVRWVIDHVINGLISAFDWVSGKVGGPHIPSVHPFGLATGGRIPGYGGGDRHMTLLEGGEAVVSKETTAAHAAELRSWGVPGFQRGGVTPQVARFGTSASPTGGGWGPLGGIAHAVGGVAHWIGHTLIGGGKILAALATGNTTALLNAIKGMIPGGVGGAVGDLAALLVDIPKKLLSDAIHFLIHTAASAFGSPFSGHYGAGVAQWRGTVLRALAMEGLSAALASRVLYQMQTESGGNPNAINLWDSNAKAGDPSRGLLQVIMSTFRAYHQPGTSWNIYNPLANIAAAIAYARSRYGPMLMSGGMGMGSGHGYDLGGWLLGPPNYTGRPEAVLNPAQSQAFLDLARALHDAGNAYPHGGTSLEAKMERLIAAVRQNAAQTGQAVGDALNGAARAASYRASYSVR